MNNGKKGGGLVLLIVFCLLIAAIYAMCSDSGSSSYKSSKSGSSYSGSGYSSGKSSSSSSGYKSSGSTGSKTSSFTNKYGTPTTKCAHAGCNNYIASSGDTNCCTIHSNKCLNCGAYIDEDAMYCMSCLTKASTKSSSGSGKSSYSSGSVTAGGPGICKYKVGNTYVCTKKATNGNFCKEHYDYLNDAYNSLFGD